MMQSWNSAILPGLPGGPPWSAPPKPSRVIMPKSQLILPPKVVRELKARHAITHLYQRAIDHQRWGLPYWEVRP